MLSRFWVRMFMLKWIRFVWIGFQAVCSLNLRLSIQFDLNFDSYWQHIYLPAYTTLAVWTLKLKYAYGTVSVLCALINSCLSVPSDSRPGPCRELLVCWCRIIVKAKRWIRDVKLNSVFVRFMDMLCTLTRAAQRKVEM